MLMALEEKEGKKIQIYSSNTSSSGRLVTAFWKGYCDIV